MKLRPARLTRLNRLTRLTRLATLVALLGPTLGCGGGDPAETTADAVAASDAKTGNDTGNDTAAAAARARLLGDDVLVIAHRGGKRERPEHTLAAYERALAVGADLIELDLHRTKDGVIVSIHDVTVDRTTDGTGAVKELTWAELSALDAGHTWSPDGGKTHPYRGKGLRIARADEVLKAFPNALISVEIKQHEPSIVEDVVALFEAHGAVHRTLFSSFADPTMQALRERAPTAVTAMAMGELLSFAAMDEGELATWTPPCAVVQPPEDMVDQAFVDRAHKAGLKVQPWTVNKPARMQALIDLGVDGLFTDDPAAMIALLPAD